ncbi:hypothetical protein DM02DRAFT_260175 [Periconia macrospinosa]|uniref:Zn(2)-C6 fungal-type domain-containing protein n=1 Tax=Periconia macrospinosa TaxID=97972 RepID=A0A2V1D4C7_9PLEO|nr:hypothetical protein DM02DRAFT_260175 [Periconia macrospinosa]
MLRQALTQALLAPKQIACGIYQPNDMKKDQSPTLGTYTLPHSRRKATLLACENCRKRKCKCDGLRPRCSACQGNSRVCVYRITENAEGSGKLRQQLKSKEKEINDMKSIIMLLVASPYREIATLWASELQKNGFVQYSAQEIATALCAIDGGSSLPKTEDLQEVLRSEQPQHGLIIPFCGNISQDERTNFDKQVLECAQIEREWDRIGPSFLNPC